MPEDELADLPVVFSFAEIPLDGFRWDEATQAWVDEEEGQDGDNSVLEHFPDGLPADAQPRGLMSVPTPRRAQVKALGPLRRELRLKPVPMRGLDVRAVYRALSRAGCATWVKGGTFPLIAGVFFFRSVRKFQKKAGLPVDGVYGNATHRALGRYFDAYAIKLYQDAKVGLTGAELKRQKFRSHCLYLYANRHLVRYTMSGSRMTIVRKNLRPDNVFRYGQIWEDCSSIGKGLCKWIGIPDPNGFGYGNPWGFTGTSSVRGVPVPHRADSLKIGDHIYTGWSPFNHMWYSIGSGLGFSHGKDSDPRIVPWSYRPVARIRRFITED
jgi:hypothetical protein